eukprot:CAMPEP_0170591190 /NCGR_PEP_ID=MMETSP0224-20130122/12272_1 /TAXON_ID=285029 /ORGANISM="Togula jolla, Strain CCCM 725" /LENGTH=205 /DNA_ID=CAMNT_0010915039 /DNA_START=56 /DNA_END=673 /DNA_ORIENTATION=-
MDFWKIPMADLAEDEAAQASQAKQKAVEPFAEPGPAGLLRDIKEGKFKDKAVAEKGKTSKKGAGKDAKAGKEGKEQKGSGHGGVSGVDERGWLPKAEYEAKKREERWRSAGKDGASSAKGGGKRGWSSKGWVDIPVEIPERPAPTEETPEIRQAREAEERRMLARDALRAADSAEALRQAIAVATELGLREEVKAGERKLAKMGE